MPSGLVGAYRVCKKATYKNNSVKACLYSSCTMLKHNSDGTNNFLLSVAVHWEACLFFFFHFFNKKGQNKQALNFFNKFFLETYLENYVKISVILLMNLLE